MNNWIKLKDKKPLPGQTVLVYEKARIYPRKPTEKNPYRTRDFYLVDWYEGRENEGSKFTHWMELPSVPEE